jgi:hypothetical protein
MVLIRAKDNSYLCVEVPVRSRWLCGGWARVAAREEQHSTARPHRRSVRSLQMQPTLATCAARPPHTQDISFGQYDADKLQAVEGCTKHSVYRDSDGMLW